MIQIKRELTDEEVAIKPLRYPIFVSVTVASLLAIAILPYSIGRFLDQWQTQRAIDLANEDWAAGAVLYQMQGRNEYRDKFIDVCYLYDPETGLELKPFVKKGLIFQQTYNDQIQKLLKQNGSPAYAYNNMPSPEQLLAFMDAEDASLITTFPQIVGGSLLELQPKDSTTSQAIDNLALTYDGDQISDHNSNDKIAVTVTPGYIWVRENNDHVELYSHTGKLLLWADRQVLTSKVLTSNTTGEQKQTSSSPPNISKDQDTDHKPEPPTQSPVN